MSWNDPCSKCTKPRYACECVYEPVKYTKEESEKMKNIQKDKEEMCKKEGHQWEYSFIVNTCKRCGETTEY